MKRFLAVFPIATNVHLIKDVGMIPYILHKELNYESTLLCYKNDDYHYLETEVKGLKIIYLKKIFHHPLLDVLYFLTFNARKYQVMQVFQLLRSTLLLCAFFKIFTLGKGKTYLKLDADDRMLQYTPSMMTKHLLKKINVVSVENKSYLERLNETKQLGRNVSYVPNGFYDNGLRQETHFENKTDKIITVGRIGTDQKATEILCKAFQEFALSNSNWQLEVIGPIEDHFRSFIANYFNENPNLKERVTFTGPINNREELEHYYRTAKIFALTSRYEGFPLVLTEAARFGCYIISTDLPASRDVMDWDLYGSVFSIDDHRALATILTNITQKEHKLATAIQSFAYQHFYWPEICKNIDLLLWKK